MCMWGEFKFNSNLHFRFSWRSSNFIIKNTKYIWQYAHSVEWNFISLLNSNNTRTHLEMYLLRRIADRTGDNEKNVCILSILCVLSSGASQSTRVAAREGSCTGGQDAIPSCKYIYATHMWVKRTTLRAGTYVNEYTWFRLIIGDICWLPIALRKALASESRALFASKFDHAASGRAINRQHLNYLISPSRDS